MINNLEYITINKLLYMHIYKFILL